MNSDKSDTSISASDNSTNEPAKDITMKNPTTNASSTEKDSSVFESSHNASDSTVNYLNLRSFEEKNKKNKNDCSTSNDAVQNVLNTSKDSLILNFEDEQKHSTPDSTFYQSTAFPSRENSGIYGHDPLKIDHDIDLDDQNIIKEITRELEEAKTTRDIPNAILGLVESTVILHKADMIVKNISLPYAYHHSSNEDSNVVNVTPPDSPDYKKDSIDKIPGNDENMDQKLDEREILQNARDYAKLYKQHEALKQKYSKLQEENSELTKENTELLEMHELMEAFLNTKEDEKDDKASTDVHSENVSESARRYCTAPLEVHKHPQIQLKSNDFDLTKQYQSDLDEARQKLRNYREENQKLESKVGELRDMVERLQDTVYRCYYHFVSVETKNFTDEILNIITSTHKKTPQAVSQDCSKMTPDTLKPPDNMDRLQNKLLECPFPMLDDSYSGVQNLLDHFGECFESHYEHYEAKVNNETIKLIEALNKYPVSLKGELKNTIVFAGEHSQYLAVWGTLEKIMKKFTETSASKRLNVVSDKVIKLTPRRPSELDVWVHLLGYER